MYWAFRACNKLVKQHLQNSERSGEQRRTPLQEKRERGGIDNEGRGQNGEKGNEIETGLVIEAFGGRVLN